MFSLGYKKLFTLILMVSSLLMLQGCVEEDQESNDPSVITTDSYRIEYLDNMDMISEGRSVFTIQITDRSTDQSVSGLMVGVMPMMDMVSGHMHSTPVENVVDNGDGTYTITLYYLMPSEMMDGTVMGVWDLEIMIGGMGGESAHFTPDVMMAMGNTSKVRLKGQTDMIAGMSMNGMPAMPMSRNYNIFYVDLTGTTADHAFDFYVTAQESMMSFPAAYTGQILNAGDTSYELTIASMTVEISTDGGTTWVAASEVADGHWTVAGLTGLTDGAAGDINLRMSVNGEQKTTDGMAPAGDGSNDYATFTVTP